MIFFGKEKEEKVLSGEDFEHPQADRNRGGGGFAIWLPPPLE
jgi:hypothetical protein